MAIFDSLKNHIIRGYVKATKFITDGGLPSHFVKGDGSLDTTQYAPTTDPRFHTHANKAVIDDISANDTSNWNEAYNHDLQSITENGAVTDRDITVNAKTNSRDGYGTGEFEIVFNDDTKSLDFNHLG